ncbi:hypothetical protein MUA48_08765 [Staphylococcus sp. IVB6238]|nr:hypothetical protein MUA48_08765 [Staphylococcus sp. IVB6238]
MTSWGDNMAKPNDKFYNVVKMLSSIGVSVKKTKSRLDIMRSLPNTTVAPEKLK